MVFKQYCKTTFRRNLDYEKQFMKLKSVYMFLTLTPVDLIYSVKANGIYLCSPLLYFSECKFTCTSGKCLDLGSLVCNQKNDCGDNSDEENCLLVTEHPPPSIFSCKYLALPSSLEIAMNVILFHVVLEKLLELK